MPCDDMTHNHRWPERGPLTIERCEVYCQYCTTDEARKHRHKFAWFLRRHVGAVHIKRAGASNPHVLLNEGW